MGCTNANARNPGRKPHPADISGQIAGMVPVTIGVAMEPDLESVAVELGVRGGPRRTYGLAQLLLTPSDALELATRLAGTVERWRAERAREPSLWRKPNDLCCLHRTRHCDGAALTSTPTASRLKIGYGEEQVPPSVPTS
jgi:hypothetical protein